MSTSRRSCTLIVDCLRRACVDAALLSALHCAPNHAADPLASPLRPATVG